MSIFIPASLDRAALLRRFWRSAASLSLADAATRLDTTPDALRHRISRGVCPIPYVREEARYRFRAEDIDAYLAMEDVAA